MTDVVLDVVVPTGRGAARPAAGVVRWTPTHRHVAGRAVVLPAAFHVTVTAGDAPVVKVAPSTGGWAWIVDELLPGGRTGRVLAVPDSDTPVRYADLAEVDPGTLDPLDPLPPSAAEVLADARTARDEAVAAAGTAADDVRELVAGDVEAAAGSANAAAGSASAASTARDEAVAARDAAPKWWRGTQAQYDAIAVKDPGTLYLVVPA